MTETPQPRLTRVGIIKLVFFVLIVSIFIGLAVHNAPTNPVGNGLDTNNKETREALIASLDEGSEKLNNSKAALMETGIYLPDPLTEPSSIHTVEPEVVMCPQYRLPVLPELPELPPKEVMDTVSKDQLNFILYQHIKAHQERTVEARKRIYASYAEYLKGCE